MVSALSIPPAFANWSCDKHAEFLRSEMVPAWRMAQRGDHSILREAWSSDFDRRLFPSCTLSYDEYFGINGNKSKQNNKRASDRSAASVPKQNIVEPSDKDTQEDNIEKLSRLQDKASGDETLNPWGGQKGRKPKKSGGDGRAPYADGKCITIKRSGKGDIDWDFVAIRNLCGFPVQVITCYHDKGDEQRCSNPYAPPGWGTSDTIKPGGTVSSVASASRPGWVVKYFVCNMKDAKKNSLLCLQPKKGMQASVTAK